MKIICGLLHKLLCPLNLIFFIEDFTVGLLIGKYSLRSCSLLEIFEMGLNPVVPFLYFDLLSLALYLFNVILLKVFLRVMRSHFTLRILGLWKILIGDSFRFLSSYLLFILNVWKFAPDRQFIFVRRYLFDGSFVCNSGGTMGIRNTGVLTRLKWDSFLYNFGSLVYRRLFVHVLLFQLVK